MPERPSPNTPLCALDKTPLSDESEQVLRRARAFLYGIAQPARQVAALMADYTPELHRDGVYRLSWLSGERLFGEWRDWRSLRPPRDPQLPEQVAALAAFADKWLPRAVAAAGAVADDDDRAEVLALLEPGTTYPSTTWRAKATVRALRALCDAVWPPHRVVWERLEAEGFAAELPAFEARLKTVEDFIASAALDSEEIADIHRAREDAASHVQEWLDARKAQLAAWDARDRAALGLGEAPPPPGFEPPLALLARFGPTARA
jgi:hypothetical protein